MVEVEEPEIKLFGMKILLPENGKKKAVVRAAGESSDEIDDENCGGPNSGLRLDDNKVSGVEQEEDADKEQQQIEEDGLLQHCSSSDDPKTPPIDEDIASTDPPKTHNDQTDESNSQHKTLKKPDKILPCPRCKSMDTKFCYYNNYNVNQPRHFCRSCQRYWTAGGNMRNVPVGAGRRKNKNSASHCHHITISDALKVETLNGFHHKHNGTVLSFDNCPSGSSVNTKSMVEGGKSRSVEPPMQNMNGFSYIPWTLPWGVTVPFSAVCPTGFLYPMPYWVPPFPTQRASCPTFPYSHLGKRSRDGEVLRPDKLESRECAGERNLESSIVVPKTLRIDNPDEAAKSPIWATLGIKYDSAKREGLFKAFQSGGDKKKPMMSTSAIMHANPAALSRSLGFQENA